jgi:hypothetical protein
MLSQSPAFPAIAVLTLARIPRLAPESVFTSPRNFYSHAPESARKRQAEIPIGLPGSQLMTGCT